MSTATETQSFRRLRPTSGQVVKEDQDKRIGDKADQGQKSIEDKFFWTYTEEPHRTRRQAIIKAHKEVLQLCGPEPLTKYLVLSVVILQIICAGLLRNSPVFSWPFLLTAYFVGATANQNLFLAIHEISHNLAFRRPLYNRLLAIFANLPIGVPYSAGFRQYHLTHHKSLGVDGVDTDLPTALEAIFLDSVFGKAFFCTFQLLFYAIRPMMIYKIPFGPIHYCNIAAQIVFDVVLVRYLGSKALVYLLMSSFLAGSLHPCAAHFISEHYVFAKSTMRDGRVPKDVPIPETFSYYGPLNILTYNVGYHNEHHDFPAIPWTRLPKVYEIAREFYDPLPCHKSWPLVLWQFITDKEVGMWCRVKRSEGGRIVGVKLDVQPTTVILSPQSDAASESQDTGVRRQVSLIDSDEDNHPLPYEIEIRPSHDFSYESALNKLINLPLFASHDHASEFFVPGEAATLEEGLQPEELGLTKRRGKLIQVSSWLDLHNRVSIGCMGAVIGYLQRRRSTQYQDDGFDTNLPWRGFNLKDVTFMAYTHRLVNTDTLMSLQIVQPESSPAAHKQCPRSSVAKEPLSIHGLFQKNAKTPQGKVLLRQAFLRPSLDMEHIIKRLDIVSVFVRPDNDGACRKLTKNLSKIKNMRTTTTLLQKGIDSGKQKYNAFKSGVWASLLDFCYHTIEIADTLQEVLGADRLPLFVVASDVLDRHSLQRLGRMIYEIVDLDASTDQQRTVIKPGVNEQLDGIKIIYDDMEDMLTTKAVEISRSLPAGVIVDLEVTYLPHMGFHVGVLLDAATGQPVYDGRQLGWQRTFNTEKMVYFKNAAMNELDEDLGDLYVNICDLEIEIAYDLAQKVLEEAKLLVTASDICGELDCNLAFAHTARQYKMTRPRITEDNVIEIKGGRHLLQELTVPSFVPNDTFLVGGRGDGGGGGRNHNTTTDGPSLLILTGPNYSGKSVYQKQVALAVYMAQVGSYVPADAATIGITDKIYTRITSRESVSSIGSAFMIDMQQIAMALNSCTRRSLIVVDEFGKGTDSCDGAGLAAGVLQHLSSLGPETPKALVATHFHEIFELGLFDTATNIAFAHMEVRVDERKGRHEGHSSTEVTHLYNLRPGRSDTSYGVQCAAQNGVPREVVERANELARLSRNGEDMVAMCSALGEAELEELRSAEMVARTFKDQDFGQEMMKEDLLVALDAMLGAPFEEIDG
ncbi:dihydroceramide delta(4)-desaturase, partial [Aureobasidium melanogenum]